MVSSSQSLSLCEFPSTSSGMLSYYSPNGSSCFSAINDILDKDVFTLEELLEEDELLQEVKSRNTKLIDL